MNDKKLTKKEREFCEFYAQLQNPKEAAIKSGFDILPEYRANNLLSKKKIRDKIAQIQKDLSYDENLVSAGFRRLAFGSIADAVKLILSCKNDETLDVDSLDLFSVSEIKFTCGKGMEIKFFDRIKALEALKEMSYDKNDSSSLNFYEALIKSTEENNGAN